MVDWSTAFGSDPGSSDGGDGGGDVDVDAGGGIDAPNIGGTDSDGSQAGGGIDAPDPGGQDPGGGGTDAGGGIDAPDPGGEDPGGGGTQAGGGIDAPDLGGEDIPPPSDGNGEPAPPDPGDVQDDPTGDGRGQPPGAGPETIRDPEPVQGIETVTGAGGDVGQAFRGRAIEQRALEQNPNLSARDVRVMPDGRVVLTTTGRELFVEQAEESQREALRGIGFEGTGDSLRPPEAPTEGGRGDGVDISMPAGGFETIRGGSPVAPEIAQEAERRERTTGTTFELPFANIEAQVGEFGQGQQPADIRPTRGFERQELGDEAFQATIPGPFRGFDGASVTFPGAGEDVEEFLGQQSREFGTFAEQVGTGVEEAIPIPGLGGAAGETAEGVTGFLNPAGFALTGIEAGETGAFLAGGLPGVGEGDFGQRFEAVAGQTGPATVETGEFAQENPFEFTGMLAAGAVTGAAAGRTIQGAPNVARSARIRAQGGDIFGVEELSDPPETTMGELPRFTDPAVEDPDVAVREFQRQAERGALSEATGEPTVFSGRAAEDVAQFGGFGRRFEAPEGGAEIPGLFFAADLSPLRLPGSTGGGLSVPRPGLPRPRVRQARVAAEVDPDVRRMPEGVGTLEEAGTFMRQQADPSGVFVRSERLITPEQEAIAPPGAGFAGEELFGIRVGGTRLPFTDRTIGGEIVTGRTFRRTESGEVDVGDVVDESTQALAETRRLQQRDREPTAPVAPTTPGGVGTDPTAPTGGFEVTGTTGTVSDLFTGSVTTTPATVSDPAAPTQRRPPPTETDVAPSAPSSVSTPFGPISSSPSGPSAPPTEPPTAIPSQPPTQPPSMPPSTPFTPSRPPSAPPGGPPTTPPMLPPTVPPNTPFTPTPADSGRRDRDDDPINVIQPAGAEFANPIASGFSFLFGPSINDVTDLFGGDGQ